MQKRIKKIVNDISLILAKEYEAVKDNSLLGGTSGILLYFFYLYRVTKKRKWRNICVELIERHLADIQTDYLRGYTLAEGAIGVFWVLIHINNHDKTIFEGNDIEEILAEFDDFIIENSCNDYQNNHYDLLHGPLGSVFYFLERKNHSEKIQKFFADSVIFFEKYQDTEGGWPIQNEQLGRPYSGEKVFDLGLSHGNPSISMLLGQLNEKNYFVSDTRDILYKNLNWLSQCKLSNETSLYPVSIEDNHFRGGILGWCYGDLGISLTLLSLARLFNDDVIQSKAIEVVQNSLGRIDEVNYNNCHSICHGTAGVAFILQQIEKKYGIDTKKATNIALEATLSKAHTFKSSHPYQNNLLKEKKIVWEDNVSFLEGLAGIGLVLLSFISDIEPEWKKCLLI